MRKALLTGGTGFLGEALARSLAGDQIELLLLVQPSSNTDVLADLPHVRFVRFDGSVENLHALIESEAPDVVFHLASLFLAEHRASDVERLIHANIVFGTQLVEAMCSAGCKRLVNVGSVWQHYHSPAYRPANLYAATKQAFRDLLAFYHEARELSCITLKLSDTYGPRDRRSKLLALLCRLAKDGGELDMSPGEQEINLLYVDDVVAGLRCAGELLLSNPQPVLQDFFLAGDSLSIKALVSVIEELSQRSLRINWGGRPYRAREVMQVSIDRSAILPGWAPRVPLRTGLQHYLASNGVI